MLRKAATLAAATIILGCCGCQHEHASTYIDDDIAFLKGTNQPVDPKSYHVHWSKRKPKQGAPTLTDTTTEPESKPAAKPAAAPETEKTTPASTRQE